MSRRRYRRRVRASAEQMETLGLVTQAEYVLRTRQVYVDVILQPTPVVETTADCGVGGAGSGAVPTSVLSAPTGESSVDEERAVGQRTQLGPLLAERRVLAVLGAAGSGKTTLARYTALELAEREWRPWRRRFWRRRPLPVLLYLRDHAEVILHSTPDGSTSGLEHAAATARFLRGVVTAAWMPLAPSVHLSLLGDRNDPRVRDAVRQVNQARLELLARTYRELGLPPDRAASRTRVAYAAILGLLRGTNRCGRPALRRTRRRGDRGLSAVMTMHAD
ncbi:hypothetical protein ITP53_32595 [Nonomuraea sp. K274]|uniref:Uncharacterized protein n=1 Tax=Nonomuraea cypriaca TaxID=1187855 RepID=A0A931F000_9ACTN|nr:hypothetical protein [Nonomuraea cypriaca]MBF8190369.1 hypothetical protein [Nonomuraea cypriaca]